MSNAMFDHIVRDIIVFLSVLTVVVLGIGVGIGVWIGSA